VRDWNTYALAHLSSLRLATANKKAVALELGEHLEEFYAALRSRGVPEEQAFLQTCAQAGNWEELCDGIFAANKEVTMLDRIKQIWGPAAVTFIFGYAALMILDAARIRGVMSRAHEPRSLAYYLPWLLLLLPIGAAGAYMSRYARGDGWRVYLATSFPVLVFAGVLLILIATVAATDPQRLAANPKALVLLLANWVALPGLALCSGAALQGLLGTQPSAH
jgi:hypothetical protein